MKTIHHMLSSGTPHTTAWVVHKANLEGEIHIVVCVDDTLMLGGAQLEHPYIASLGNFFNFVDI